MEEICMSDYSGNNLTYLIDCGLKVGDWMYVWATRYGMLTHYYKLDKLDDPRDEWPTKHFKLTRTGEKSAHIEFLVDEHPPFVDDYISEAANIHGWSIETS